MATYVIGDIHGNYIGLVDVLKKSGFNKKTDTLISLGDVCDGGCKVRQCIDVLLGIKNLVNVLGNHDCLTPDAEILTKRGWLNYTDLTLSDLVYSFDTINNVGVWMPINEIIIKDYDGDTIVTDTNRFKMQVTPTHRVLCQIRTTKQHKRVWSNYNYIHASDITGKRVKIASTISTSNTEYNISDDKIKLTAWLLTDGHIDSHGYMHIYQSKIDNIPKIEDILKSLNYNYTVSKRKRNIKEICGKQLISSINVHYEFHINADSSKEITDYISEKIKIPTWVYELSQRQFDIFLQTLILGNGTTYNRINTTTSILYGLEESLKNIQGVCATKGYTATLVHDNRGDPRLNICKCSTIQFDSSKVVSTEHYNGKVWCIVTPLTNFMVRQNGTHFFTGNCWALHWMKTGVELPVWWHQGGMRTAESYDFDYENVPKSHMKFLEDMIPYYKDEQNRVFVHGGFIPDKPIEEQDIDILTWDRELMCAYAPKGEIPGYKHVFVGHTTTQHFGRDYKIPDCMVPLTFHNLTAMDTGGGWNGRLSMMDVDTFEYWQSEFNANMQNTMKRLDGLQFK